MRILIAEDDKASSEILAKFLSYYGTCDVVHSGAAATELFRSAIEDGEPYNLVFLDIMMPEKDGHAALNEMRLYEQSVAYTEDSPAASAPQAKSTIIMTTALNDPADVGAAKCLGCDGYLTKPISRKNLINELVVLGAISKEEKDSTKTS